MKSENPSSLKSIPENSKCGTRTIGKSVIAILASFTNEDMNNPVVADDNIDKKISMSEYFKKINKEELKKENEKCWREIENENN